LLDFERREEHPREVRLRAVALAFVTFLAVGLASGSAAVVSESTSCSIDLHARNGNLDCAVALPGGEVTLSGSLTSTVAVHGGSPTAFAYDSFGRLVRAQAGTSTTSYEYDAAGRLAQRVDSSEGATRYTYDALGRLVSAGDTRLEYSDAGLVAASLPDSRVVRYSYDARGNLVAADDGTTITRYTYDEHRRLTAATATGATVEYSYDGSGRVVRRVLNGEATSYSYDKRAIVAASIAGGRAIEHTYDNDGSLLTVLTGGAATTGFGYDGMGRFVEVRGLDGERTVIQYDADGRPVFVLPEAGDEVLVSFEHGDTSDPIVIGFLWSDDDGDSYELTPRGRLIACKICP
jgi:YD repeat-containing protein